MNSAGSCPTGLIVAIDNKTYSWILYFLSFCFSFFFVFEWKTCSEKDHGLKRRQLQIYVAQKEIVRKCQSVPDSCNIGKTFIWSFQNAFRDNLFFDLKNRRRRRTRKSEALAEGRGLIG